MDETTVVVTGATSEVGRAIADAFATAGAAVAVGGRDRDALDGTVADLADAGDGAVTGLRTDVRDEYDLERLLEAASRLGDSSGVDVVVAAADVYHGEPGETPLREDSYTAFDDHWRTNARGVFATITEALPHLTEGARVVVPTGRVAREAAVGYGSYAVSRAGAEAVVRGFAADVDHPVVRLEVGETAGDAAGGDPGEIASMAVWAATEADADDVDGAVLSLEEWAGTAD